MNYFNYDKMAAVTISSLKSRIRELERELEEQRQLSGQLATQLAAQVAINDRKQLELILAGHYDKLCPTVKKDGNGTGT